MSLVPIKPLLPFSHNKCYKHFIFIKINLSRVPFNPIRIFDLRNATFIPGSCAQDKTVCEKRHWPFLRAHFKSQLPTHRFGEVEAVLVCSRPRQAHKRHLAAEASISPSIYCYSVIMAMTTSFGSFSFVK